MGQCLGISVKGYRFIKRLNSGGHGVIVLAEKQQSLYAIKRMKLKEKDIQIKREKNIFMLKSEYIVECYEGFSQGGYYNLVMEKCDGSLEDQYRNLTKPGNEDLKSNIQRQIIKGVAFLHQNHIFHSDLKLENILLKGRRAKITDFGYSRLLKSRLFTNSPHGTQEYQSPQQSKYSQKSDCYALGLILYEIESGKRVNMIRPGYKIVSRAPDFPNKAELAIIKSKKMRNIIQKLLKRNPEERITSKQARNLIKKTEIVNQTVIVAPSYQQINSELHKIKKDDLKLLTLKMTGKIEIDCSPQSSSNKSLIYLGELVSKLDNLEHFRLQFNHSLQKNQKKHFARLIEALNTKQDLLAIELHMYEDAGHSNILSQDNWSNLIQRHQVRVTVTKGSQ